MQLTDLSDDDLVKALGSLCLEGHRLTARLIVYLVEVEDRRLDLRSACSSMFDFCVRKMGMSEGAAFRRINAARLVRRFPSLHGHIERGEIHLSTLVLLRPHLNEANLDELVASVIGKTQREIETLLARRAPKPDVPSAIVKTSQPDQAAIPVHSHDAAPTAVASPRMEPLAEARFKVQFTASAELRDKLVRAADLMRHRNPSGDLAAVVETALDLLLEKLEKERLATVKNALRDPRGGRSAPPPRTTKPGRIPRSVRRAVFERDGEQCTFVDDHGCRCPSRAFLELDHVISRAMGGADDAANLRVRCRAHNRLHAEEVFGKEHIARAIDLRQRKSRPPGNAGSSPGVAPDARIKHERGPVELALFGLVNMGFAKPDARRAIDDVSRRHANDVTELPVQELLREALAVLA